MLVISLTSFALEQRNYAVLVLSRKIDKFCKLSPNEIRFLLLFNFEL